MPRLSARPRVADRRRPARAGRLRRRRDRRPPRTPTQAAPDRGQAKDQAQKTGRADHARHAGSTPARPTRRRQGRGQGGRVRSAPTPMAFLYQDPDAKADPRRALRSSPSPTASRRVASFIPASNPMTKGKVELGKQLYFDQRSPRTRTVSCASCHDPAKGWTDNLKTSVGIGGQKGGRNAPTVLNTVYGRTMFWDGRAPSLEGQAQGPIQNKIEMGDQSYKRDHRAAPDDPRLPRAVPQGLRDRRHPRRHGQGDRRLRADRPVGQLALRQVPATADPDKPETFKRLTESQKRGMVLFGLRAQRRGPVQGRHGRC